MATSKVGPAIKKIFHNHPFIVWNIIGILIAIWTHWLLWFACFIVSLIYWNKRRKELKAIEFAKKKDALIKEATEYFEAVKKNKAFPTIPTSTFLDDGEVALFQENTVLKETRAVRHSGGNFGSVRIMKGVRIGGYRGQSESTQEWRVLDQGDLLMTNKKLIFMGNKENRIMPLNKIFAIETYIDGIEITLSTKNKSIIFPVKNAYLWSSTIGLVRQIKNPLKLEGVNLNVQLI